MGLSRVAHYAQVNAVVHALYADRLLPDKLRDLAHSDSFTSFLSSLENTPYSQYLDLSRAVLSPRRTVYQLRLRLANIYEKLIRLTPQPGRSLLVMLWQSYEVDNLKATLRGIENGASWTQVLFLLSPMHNFNVLKQIKLRQMLETRNIPQAIELLQRTPYYYPLSYAIARYQDEKTMFPLEIALDLDYRRRLWNTIDQLHGEDQTQALRLIGAVLDKDNLLWAIRYRVYHHLSTEEIINYTLARGYRLHDREIRSIAKGDNIKEVLVKLYPHSSQIGALSSDITEEINVLENILTADILAQCRKTFGNTPFHIGIPLSYVLIMEQEIRTLTAIIEVKASTITDEKALNAILESYVQIAIDVQN